MSKDALVPSVCIDAVLSDRSPEDAIGMVADLGYRAVEFWGWWDKDLDAIITAKDRHGMQISACCTRFISLVDPAVRVDYLNGLRDSIDAAQRLNCRTIISQVGDRTSGVPRQQQHDCLVAGLIEAAELLRGTDITLVIEPLNELIDHPGYYLVRSDEAFEVIDKVASNQVKVVYDIYHQQISEGQLIGNILGNIDRIGHFHAAGNPGRHELTIGELHYPSIFEAIAASGFQGYVGLEYWPKRDASEGLSEVLRWFDA